MDGAADGSPAAVRTNLCVYTCALLHVICLNSVYTFFRNVFVLYTMVYDYDTTTWPHNHIIIIIVYVIIIIIIIIITSVQLTLTSVLIFYNILI